MQSVRPNAGKQARSQRQVCTRAHAQWHTCTQVRRHTHTRSLLNAEVTQWIKCSYWQSFVYLPVAFLAGRKNFPLPFLPHPRLPCLFSPSSPFMSSHFARVNHTRLFSLVSALALPLSSFILLCATGARSSAVVPVAFICLTASSRLLSRFLFISLSVCLTISMIVYLPSSSAVSFYILGILSASFCPASPYYTYARESVFPVCWPSIGHVGGVHTLLCTFGLGR